MAEVVNCLAQIGARKFFIGGNFTHGEIGLRKHNSLRIDANENLGHCFNIEVVRQVYCSNLFMLNG